MKSITKPQLKKPIKRGAFLTPLSREHHHGLLLCWKIRTGFQKNIEINRIKAYADWFYRNYLLTHFETEEKYVFSVLGEEHELVKRALSEHRRLRHLFEGVNEASENLGLIEEELEAHIRFEERILFNEIQSTASPSEIQEVLARHFHQTAGEKSMDAWKDEFWK